MSIFLRILVVTLALPFLGCTSYFKKQDCEGKNWYSYGEQVANQGRWLESDSYLQECRKVEAKINEVDLDKGFKQGRQSYCQPDAVYQLGKKGLFLSEDVCREEGLTTLKLKHAAGVNDYCRPENGLTAGAKGVAYNNICPATLEKAFVTEFEKGRISYLKVEVERLQSHIHELDLKISNNHTKAAFLRGQALGLTGRMKVVAETRYDVYGVAHTEHATVLDQDAQSEARRLENEATSLEAESSQLEGQKEQANRSLAATNSELGALRTKFGL